MGGLGWEAVWSQGALLAGPPRTADPLRRCVPDTGLEPLYPKIAAVCTTSTRTGDTLCYIRSTHLHT